MVLLIQSQTLLEPSKSQRDWKQEMRNSCAANFTCLTFFLVAIVVVTRDSVKKIRADCPDTYMSDRDPAEPDRASTPRSDPNRTSSDDGQSPKGRDAKQAASNEAQAQHRRQHRTGVGRIASHPRGGMERGGTAALACTFRSSSSSSSPVSHCSPLLRSRRRPPAAAGAPHLLLPTGRRFR